jgi:hypothetical protein
MRELRTCLYGVGRGVVVHAHERHERSQAVVEVAPRGRSHVEQSLSSPDPIVELASSRSGHAPIFARKQRFGVRQESVALADRALVVVTRLGI